MANGQNLSSGLNLATDERNPIQQFGSDLTRMMAVIQGKPDPKQVETTKELKITEIRQKLTANAMANLKNTVNSASFFMTKSADERIKLLTPYVDEVNKVSGKKLISPSVVKSMSEKPDIALSLFTSIYDGQLKGLNLSQRKMVVKGLLDGRPEFVSLINARIKKHPVKFSVVQQYLKMFTPKSVQAWLQSINDSNQRGDLTLLVQLPSKKSSLKEVKDLYSWAVKDSRTGTNYHMRIKFADKFNMSKEQFERVVDKDNNLNWRLLSELYPKITKKQREEMMLEYKTVLANKARNLVITLYKGQELDDKDTNVRNRVLDMIDLIQKGAPITEEDLGAETTSVLGPYSRKDKDSVAETPASEVEIIREPLPDPDGPQFITNKELDQLMKDFLPFRGLSKEDVVDRLKKHFSGRGQGVSFEFDQ